MHPLLSVRLALRGLRKDLPSSAAVVLILALGLAAPAVFFSLLWGGGLRPLPVPGGSGVVRVDLVQPRADGRTLAPRFDELPSLQAAGALSGLEAFAVGSVTLASPATGAARVSSAAMSPGTFQLLLVPPALGRIPSVAEVPGAVILGHDLWMELYDGAPEALGAQVAIDGVPGRVVAVMPEAFAFPFNQSAWTLLDPSADAARPVELVGRLAEGGSGALAAARLEQAWRSGDAGREAERIGGIVQVKGFTRDRGESGEAVAFGGLVLVGLCLLLIACANAATLLLVRAVERLHVLGVQSALGASRLHLASQLLAEALALAIGGGLAGLVLADLMVGYIQRSMGPENFGYWWMRVSVDGPVVLFTGALVLGTAVLAGSVPVVRVLRTDLQGVLKGSGGAGGPGPFRGWSWGRVFVTGQLALSCGALVAAGLTGRAMHTARGFGGDLPTDEILLGTVSLDLPAFDEEEPRATALAGLLEATSSLPGSRRVALALGAPGYGELYSPLAIAGSDDDDPQAVLTNAVSPSFFDLIGVGPIRGRLIGSQDGPEADPIAVVSESFVRRFLPGVEPLGTRINLRLIDTERTFRIVGIVQDLELGAGPRARNDRVYVPLMQATPDRVTVLLRGTPDPSLSTALRSAVVDWNPDVPLLDLRTLSDAYDFLTRAPANLSLLAATGGAAGLVVAAVGLYALLAFRVRRRRRELGVRLALGADASRLTRAVLGDALGQILPALIVGLVLAWLVAPLLGAFLLGGDPRSPAVFATVALTFVTTGLLAALVPAVRARAVEPAQVLRAE